MSSPGSLQLARKARELVLTHKPARLYRSIIREVPRVMQIYDLMHMGDAKIKRHIRTHFYNSSHIRDDRVVDMLLEKGYIDLEDTLLQHKQKNHLMLLLEGTVGTDNNIKLLDKNSSEEEQFVRWVH